MLITRHIKINLHNLQTIILIRLCVRGGGHVFSGEDVLKVNHLMLEVYDVSLSIIISLFSQYDNSWKERSHEQLGLRLVYPD